MPEQPPTKLKPALNLDENSAQVRQRNLNQQPLFAELHCKSNFTFLKGASHPEELADRAALLGYSALSITDENTVAGIVRGHIAAKECQLPFVVGCELIFQDAPPLVVWMKSRSGYARLSQLLTAGRRRAPKGECWITFAEAMSYASDWCAGLVLHEWVSWDWQCARSCLIQFRKAIGDGGVGLASLRCGPNDEDLLAEMLHYADTVGVQTVASNDILYHDSKRQRLHDVMTAIRLGGTVDSNRENLERNSYRSLQRKGELLRHFRGRADILQASVQIAERCLFSLEELRFEYPEELCPPDKTPISHLRNLTWKGAAGRYPKGIPDKVKKLLEHELTIIEDLKYASYFLTVWDLIHFARSREILCQGRGSAANSAVCFCLGVTSVDPDQMEPLFERFISRERNEAPDIDIDFEHERREEVLQYCYDKYGRERCGMTAVVVTYQARLASREVGKALGFSPDRLDLIAKSLHHWRVVSDYSENVKDAGLQTNTPQIQQLIELVAELVSFPRHLSQHPGGLVLTRNALCDMVPIENASMPGRTVVQWDKNDLDALGILKVDCLALGMLTAIRKAFDLMHVHYGKSLSLATIPSEDPAVYAMIQKADTVGVFQIESRAQMSMLPRLRPKTFYDLVIEVAIVRPGPIQGQMVHPYLRRRQGLEPVVYPSPQIKEVLSSTLGVPLFQEQAMKLAVVAAGFTPGEADQLRRAMATFRHTGKIHSFKEKFIRGMQERGYEPEFAKRCFQQIEGFGEYGFPESHAASFALLVYVSAWIKCHYPDVFGAAILNSQPMGFYAPAQLIRDAKEHNITILPMDINYSEWDCTLEPLETDNEKGAAFGLRLGFRLARGVSQQDIDTILTHRKERLFSTVVDLAHRTGLSRSCLAQLAAADVFHSLKRDRRHTFWESLTVGEPLPLFPEENAEEVPKPALQSMSQLEEVVADYRTQGLTLREHPISFLRPYLQKLGCVRSKDLKAMEPDQQISVAGLVLMRQQPSTAKGVIFVTLEDETGIINLIVWAKTWDKYRKAARSATVLLATGKLQKESEIIHVVVDSFANLSVRMKNLVARSRDFH